MRSFAVLLLAALSGAQPSEDEALSRAMAEAGGSTVDFMRALEKHLKKYPQTLRRLEIERALVKAAIELKDQKRVIEFGERVLARESGDLQILDRVTRALLSSEARETSERALKWSRRYVEVVRELSAKGPNGRRNLAEWRDEIDGALARAYVLQARATGNLGRTEEAIALARRSYEAYPNAESAREIGRWLLRAGREEEALAPLADAFTIADERSTDAQRAQDRARVGEVYRKLQGHDKGLGDLVLAAYDRTTALLAARRTDLQAADPNAFSTRILDFTLPGLAGDRLALASLRGNVLVMDFWATWCGPCRVQHPLYEEVKKRFKNKPEVVFLSINTDEDREIVRPFLREQKWTQKVYFEDGLSRLLQVSSIPTTIIVNKRGDIASRMNGFLPDRFVDMLTDRIHDALVD